MKQCPPRRLAELALPFLAQAGYLDVQPSPDALPWVERLLAAVLKNISTLSQLPEAARLVFEYDAGQARRELELSSDAGALPVLAAFVPKVLAEPALTYERFRAITREVQSETGKKGKDLFHPIRIALTGAASGPELEKLIPLFELGAQLPCSATSRALPSACANSAPQSRAGRGVAERRPSPEGRGWPTKALSSAGAGRVRGFPPGAHRKK